MVGNRTSFLFLGRPFFIKQPFFALAPGDLGSGSFFDRHLAAGKCLAQPLHGKASVLALRASFARLDNDPRGKVSYPDSGVRYIPMLSAGSGSAKKFHLNVRFFNFHGKPDPMSTFGQKTRECTIDTHPQPV